MDEGWISLHRRFKNHWLWSEKRVFSKAEAWIDLLLNVNHANNKIIIKNKLFDIKRGQSIMSLESWSKRWNWNKSKVRRFLKVLQVDEMILLKNETKTTRITICNYDSYQTLRYASETQVKRKRNASETQVTPNNNDNKENKENNNIESRKTEFKNSLRSFLDLYGKIMLTDFFEYWTEHGDKDKKMRFEKQTSFSISRRLKTWKLKSDEFKNKGKL